MYVWPCVKEEGRGVGCFTVQRSSKKGPALPLSSPWGKVSQWRTPVLLEWAWLSTLAVHDSWLGAALGKRGHGAQVWWVQRSHSWDISQLCSLKQESGVAHFHSPHSHYIVGHSTGTHLRAEEGAINIDTGTPGGSRDLPMQPRAHSVFLSTDLPTLWHSFSLKLQLWLQKS